MPKEPQAVAQRPNNDPSQASRVPKKTTAEEKGKQVPPEPVVMEEEVAVGNVSNSSSSNILCHLEHVDFTTPVIHIYESDIEGEVKSKEQPQNSIESFLQLSPRGPRTCTIDDILRIHIDSLQSQGDMGSPEGPIVVPILQVDNASSVEVEEGDFIQVKSRKKKRGPKKKSPIATRGKGYKN